MPGGPDAPTLLQRVLLLERQQGFQDRAAVGGIETFARRQVEIGDAARRADLERAASLLDGYSALDRRGRESALRDALAALLGGPRPTSTPVDDGVPDPSPPPSRAPSPARSRPALRVVHTADELDAPIAGLKGIRRPAVQALANLGVETVHDLLYFLPRTHYDYADTRSISRLRIGEKTTLVGTIQHVRNNRTSRGIVITTAAVADDTGAVGVRWFNQPYLAQKLPVGARIAVSGEPDVHNGYITFAPKDFELIEDADLTHTGRLVPMYPLTKGLYQKSLRTLMRNTVEEYADALEDYLPDGLVARLKLPALSQAIRQFHFPDDENTRARAEQRLAFDELLLIQLGLLLRKHQWQEPDPRVSLPVDAELDERFRTTLPFTLTGAQETVLSEIYTDLARPVPMSRLLEGDVGSGKTVVAAAALLQVVNAGHQAVLMAPTEILADQHYRTLTQLLEPFGVTPHLLIGSTPKAERRSLYDAAADGTASIVVGTHALIQEGLEFDRLRLAITDEQHRFGVEQRAALRQKGLNPHVLAMTATPIPRTLAMTIYGDLDVSIIDEMPPGRLPPITTWCRTPVEAYGVIRDEVSKGHQAFVICPVIEDSADSDMRSAIAEHKGLASMTFADLNVGLLHGRMKPSEKDRILTAFRRGEYQVLVATSVVEVGIDVPNATVMVIRDAHRFGLAQLHQFRGRVGRAGDQAHCVLLSDTEGDEARERLEALTATENGFELAEEDLRLRGPGEFWGTRQSGLPELRVARLGDVATIQLARRAALELLASDTDLSQPDHAALRDRVRRFWSATADLS